MANPKFLENLNKNVTKSLKGKLAGPVEIRVMGDPGDQHKGLGDDLKTSLIPFRSSTYEAQEYVYVRAPLNDGVVTFIDFVGPLLNIKDDTIPGVGAFMTHIPHPCAETFVERMVGFKYQLFPHSLVILQRLKPQDVMKQGMVRSKAIAAVNADKKLCRKLSHSNGTNISAKGLSNKVYKITFDWLDHPGGTFCATPFNGNTVMVTRDCGRSPKVNKPDYSFKDVFDGFKGVGDYIAKYPEQELYDGKFYIDTALAIMLGPAMTELKK